MEKNSRAKLEMQSFSLNLLPQLRFILRVASSAKFLSELGSILVSRLMNFASLVYSLLCVLKCARNWYFYPFCV